MKRKLPAVVLGLLLTVTITPIINSERTMSYVPESFGTTTIIHSPQPRIILQLMAIPDPTPKPTPKPVLIYYKVKYGTASTYGPGYTGLLALPEGRGIKVEVCGPAGCIIRRSNDAGPNLTMQRAGRIIDLNLKDFRLIGGSYKLGLINNVRVSYFNE